MATGDPKERLPDEIVIADTLPHRIALASLAPLFVWLIFCSPGLLSGIDGTIYAILVLWWMCLPITLPFAFGQATIRKIELRDGLLSVRWRSFGDQSQTWRLEELARVSLTGNTLRILPRGEPVVRMRVPTAFRKELADWIGELERALPGPVEYEAALPARLDSAITERSHEGFTLRLAPVHAPIPDAFAYFGIFGLWFLSFIVGVMLVEAGAISWPLIPVVLALEAIAVALAAGRQIRAVEVSLVGPRIEALIDRRIGARRISIPLADVIHIEVVREGLRLLTPDGLVLLPLPYRSQETLAQLEALLSQQAQGAIALRGTVAPELSQLVGERVRAAQKTPEGR